MQIKTLLKTLKVLILLARQICFGSNTPSAYKQLAQIFRSEGKNRKALRMYATYEVMFSFLRVQNAVEHVSHS